jgi:HlyD family secretion protein
VSLPTDPDTTQPPVALPAPTDPPPSPTPPTLPTPTPPTPPSVASAPASDDTAALLDEPAQRAWYLRPVWWASCVALALAGGGWWYWQARKAANAAPVYTTQVVARGDLTLSVAANGTLQPTRTINIGSELSGTVLRVNVDVNDAVKKGQVLAVLDMAKLRNQILRGQATIASAEGRVALTHATTAEMRATLNRLEAVARLSGGKVPSQTELDSARAGLARASADSSSAEASVRDAHAALATDQINLSKASIASPGDGMVLTRSVDPGNAVAASLQAVTLFTLGEDLHKLRLWVYVDEADVGVVQVGQRASFTVSAFVTRTFAATITRVGFGSTITDNVVTYLTYLDVDNADLALRPGMTATATITATERQDVLLVPNSALRFTPSAADVAATPSGPSAGFLPRMPRTSTRRSAADTASTANAKQVWVLPPGDKAVPMAVAVTPGISDGRMTEITGGDLQAGMLVITDQKLGTAP